MLPHHQVMEFLKYPTSENAKIDPQYPYALTKRLIEELVMHYSKIYNLNSTSLRFFNVYGPRARTLGHVWCSIWSFLAQEFRVSLLQL